MGSTLMHSDHLVTIQGVQDAGGTVSTLAYENENAYSSALGTLEKFENQHDGLASH